MRRRDSQWLFSVAIVLALALSMGVVRLSAATISWGSATNISGNSDVLTMGTTVQAWNFGTSATGVAGTATDTTVNGVLFAAAGVTPSGTNSASFTNTGYLGNPGITLSTTGTVQLGGWNTGVGSATGAYAALSSDYKAMLGTMAFAGIGSLTPPDAVMTVTFSNLVIGRPYVVQVWVNESRSNVNNVQNRSGKIDTVSVDYNTTNSLGGLGQWVSGTFTADSSTQSFVSSGTSGLPNPAYMNAVQLRLVPEPSSFAIAGIGIGALFGSWVLRGRSRRRDGRGGADVSAADAI